MNLKSWNATALLSLPISGGRVTQAGPGLLYSAAMGPRLFVGVHDL